MSDPSAASAASALIEHIQAPRGSGRDIPDAATREVIGRAPVRTVISGPGRKG